MVHVYESPPKYIGQLYKVWKNMNDNHDENIRRIKEQGVPQLQDSDAKFPEGFVPPTKDEMLASLEKEFQERCEKEFKDILEYMKDVRERLDHLKVHNDIVANAHTLEDPESNHDMLHLAGDILVFRSFIKESIELEEFMPLDDLVDFCEDMKMETEYVDLINKYYKTDEQGVNEIIDSFIVNEPRTASTD